jgi:mono/diheme cytochrome c family protein
LSSACGQWTLPLDSVSVHFEVIMLFRPVLAAAVLAPLALVAPALALDDPAAGKATAVKWCASCHLVEEGQAAAPAAGVPSFAAIAAKPDQTAERIAGAIVVPHPPMPDLQLSRQQIADLAAYILTLRK